MQKDIVPFSSPFRSDASQLQLASSERGESSASTQAGKRVSNRDISFGLIFFSSNEAPFGDDKYRLVMESARFADGHGFSSIWIPERHFTKDGWLYPNPVVLQAALARETKRIGLRAGSVVMPLHNPIRVAEDWAMVDNLSGGRVGLSFASGWHPNDFVFFPDHYANRNEVMYQGIETVRKLWRGESVQAQGGDGKTVEIRTYPTPIQRELPIWITAAGNPKTFMGAGEIGANLLTHMYNQSINELAEKIRLYREARAKHGYDPESGQVSVMLHTFIGETLESVQEQIREPFSNYLKSASYLINAIAQSRGQQVDLASLSEQDVSEYLAFVLERLISTQRVLFGTPESCYEQVMQMKAAGVTEIACQMDFGVDIDLVMQSMPHLNELKERCKNPQDGQQTTLHASPSLSTQIHSAAQENRVQASTSSNGRGPQTTNELTATQQRCQQEVNVAEFYAMLSARGVQLGTSFQGIRQLWRGNNEALGLIQLPTSLFVESERYQTHPALLDACFQVLLAALPTDIVASKEDALYLPTGLGSFSVHTPPNNRVWSRSVIHGTPNSNAAVFEGDVYLLNDEGQVLITATGLRLQRSEPVASPLSSASSNEHDELQEWLYELQWEPWQSLAAQQASVQAGTWLIFMDSQGVGQRVANWLTGKREGVGQGVRQGVINQTPTCIMVSPSYSYQAIGENHYRINPTSVEDMQRLFKEAFNGDATTLNGILHLWSLDMTPPERTSVTSLEADQTLGTGSALNLIQALLGTKLGQQSRLWFVTRGAQAVEAASSERLEVAQSPLWGLGRTCAIEHPELWGGLIDIDSHTDANATASQLLAILAQQSREDQIAIRNNQSYVARMVRSQHWTPAPLHVRHDATYLITGGLWGLGLEVGQWLARKGARHLVLLGRSILPERAQWDSVQVGSRQARQIAGLRELERLGVHVQYAPVDVANEAQLKALVQDLPQQGFPAIKGIVHAASVWQDARGESLVHPLINLDASSLQTVFRPKVEGAWLLYSLFADTPLDFFVSFSSGASLFGSAAQGNYAAAGAFLDSLAHAMRANGQPALSIDWGAISETGFGATAEGQRVHEYWESHGIGRITPRHVLAALELLIPQQAAQVGVLKLDWRQLQQFYPQLAQLPLVAHLVDTSDTEHDLQATPTSQASSVLQLLVEAGDRTEQQRRLELYLSEQVAGVLRVPQERLDREQPLTALGLDSLMAIELRNRIERELAVHISIVAFLQGPSIQQFAAQLLEQLPLATTPSSSTISRENQENDTPTQQRADTRDVAHTDGRDESRRYMDKAKQNGENGHSRPTQEMHTISQQDAAQLLAQLDQLSDEDVESLLSQITQEGDQ